MDSQNWRKPSASADEQYQPMPDVSSSTTVGIRKADATVDMGTTGTTVGTGTTGTTVGTETTDITMGTETTDITMGTRTTGTTVGTGTTDITMGTRTRVGTGLAPVRPQEMSPDNERIEEPTYQEHGGNISGQPTIEAPSFYPADLPDRQFQEWQADMRRRAGTSNSPYRPLQTQSQQSNSAYPSNQRQHANGAVPPSPVSMPRQGPVPYAPNSPYTPYSQQYRGSPVPYTNPQAYQQPAHGYVRQPQVPSPGYPPYQGYYAPNAYPQGGYPGYSLGYPNYPYAWYPPRPRRNGYQLGMAITSLVGSILAILGGILCGIILLRLTLVPPPDTKPAQLFEAVMLVTALVLAGIIGGGFGVFHSAIALAGRPSRPFKFPPFWSFLSIYIVLVIVGLMVGANDVVVNDFPLVFSLIALSGILPALTFFSLALRRVRRPKTGEWPTTWRRFTLSLVSGATSAIFLAIVFEGILTLIAGLQFIGANTSFIDNPSAPIPHDSRSLILILMLLSVIAPIVEEGFKPLAVITMIGRIRSASEAFILGMACGIGFDMIETTGYIGQGYQDWINIAIQRSTAGLLHGFGAGMMALGWYYITHKDALKRNHLQIGLGCMLYAILQHAIWNGSFILTLLPYPIGPYLESGKIPIFTYQLDSFLIVYLLFSVLMLCFLWFVTGKIRLQPDAPLRNNSRTGNQPLQATAKIAGTS